MEPYLLAAILSLGSGGLYAVIGLGAVQVYRTSGVVHFAQGAIVMYSAYVFSSLTATGTYPIPPLPNPLALVEGAASRFGAELNLPDFPTTASFGHPLPALPAGLIAVATSAILGFLLHFLIFRRLRTAPQLARVVAGVGVLLVLQSIVVRRFGGTAVPVRTVLPDGVWHVMGGTVKVDRLLVAGGVIVTALALAGFLRWTRFGVATRAAAENETAAVLLGYSPDSLARWNWMLASSVCGLMGIFVGSVAGAVDPFIVAYAVVPALGAAVVGRFSSLLVTTAAAFGIAIAQGQIALLQRQGWWPRSNGIPYPGAQQAIPLVIIVAALVLFGRKLPRRGDEQVARLPLAPRPIRTVRPMVLGLTIGVAFMLLATAEWRAPVTNSLIGVTLCLSLVVLTGFVGQISLAQMALAGLGGFGLSKLAESAGVPFPLAPLLAATMATVCGVIVGVPALRLRGVHLAIVSFSLALTAEAMVFANTALNGGSEGAPVPSPSLFGFEFGPNDTFIDDKVPSPSFGIFVLVVTVCIAGGVAWVRRSSMGNLMLAVRSNERAAAAAGVNVAGVKVFSFAIAAFIAGLGGSLIGYRAGGVDDLSFAAFASITLLGYAYLGGITSVKGAAVGGVLVSQGVGFYVISELFDVHGIEELLAGLGLILTAVLHPEGIAGAAADLWAFLKRRLVLHRRAGTPSTTRQAASQTAAGEQAAIQEKVSLQ
jgi:branched-chain amino acid transport system permease protein